MSKTVHCCISVRGMLNWDKREAKKMLRSITKNDGTRFRDVAEFRDAMMSELAAGREVLPMSPECDNFDFKTGCKGHESVGGEDK
jgi:hypothetical protein